jgi:hypothetical protein
MGMLRIKLVMKKKKMVLDVPMDVANVLEATKGRSKPEVVRNAVPSSGAATSAMEKEKESKDTIVPKEPKCTRKVLYT